MGNSQYTSIDANEDDAPLERRCRSFRSWFFVIPAVLVITGAIVSIRTHSNSISPSVGSGEDAPLEGAANKSGGGGARPCKFTECYKSSCDAKVAPFICLLHNGGPHMGCSPVPWMNGTCDDQCNLSACAGLKIPDDVANCDKKKCGDKWCKGGQVCHEAAPYQCQEGSARFGCSSDKVHWTLRADDDTCSACCDGRTCK